MQDESNSNPRSFSRARSLARRLAMQAIYEWQLNPQPWQDLHQQYVEGPDLERADKEYFRELIEKVSATQDQLDEALTPYLDRKPSGLDPLEHAILLIAAYELKSRMDVPYRVVINEGVDLAKRFGATDGHKYVNAVLDKAAAHLRSNERR